MSTKKSKLIPAAAGLFFLILIAGFVLGLRIVYEFDPTSAQIRTTQYLFVYLPISSDTHPTWISPGQPDSPDWQLMHEIHHWAGGSNIHHTHWGSIADTVILWSELDLEPEPRAQLAKSTRALLADQMSAKPKRIYISRMDAMLRYDIQDPDKHLEPAAISALFEEALLKPIENEGAMFPDP